MDLLLQLDSVVWIFPDTSAPGCSVDFNIFDLMDTLCPFLLKTND